MEQLHGCDPSPPDINHGAKNSCWSGGWQWVVFAANILWKIPLVGSLWGEMVSLFTWSQPVICYVIRYIQIRPSRHPFWECLHSCEHLVHVVLVFRFDSLVLFSVFQRNDIAMAITKFDQFDFLIDIVPRDDLKPPKRQVRKREGASSCQNWPASTIFFFYILQRLWREECAVLCLAAWGRCKHPWLEAGCRVCEGFQSDVCSALLPLSLHNQMSTLFIFSVYVMNVAIAPCAWLKKNTLHWQ